VPANGCAGTERAVLFGFIGWTAWFPRAQESEKQQEMSDFSIDAAVFFVLARRSVGG
jgi:hypothetical protein